MYTDLYKYKIGLFFKIYTLQKKTEILCLPLDLYILFNICIWLINFVYLIRTSNPRIVPISFANIAKSRHARLQKGTAVSQLKNPNTNPNTHLRGYIWLREHAEYSLVQRYCLHLAPRGAVNGPIDGAVIRGSEFTGIYAHNG